MNATPIKPLADILTAEQLTKVTAIANRHRGNQAELVKALKSYFHSISIYLSMQEIDADYLAYAVAYAVSVA